MSTVKPHTNGPGIINWIQVRFIDKYGSLRTISYT